jgi:hypothetical protein
METQKFMGSGQLVNRLASQVGSKKLAVTILQKRGHLKSDGKTLTELGKKRNAMTASQRAKDRAVKRSGGSVEDFTYNPKTNTATKLKKY